ncbi:MAG: PKD domain-containing protein, partial [Bacteroidales bacterium]
MKTFSGFLKVLRTVMIVPGLIFFTACSSDDEEPTPEPIASFQFEVSDDNGLEVAFTNFSQHATSYEWDFGDGTGTSTEENVTYTYADGGVFTVTLTATNETGSDEYTKDVTVINPVAENHIQNGEFDDDSVWEILQHNANDAGTIRIEDGVAIFNEGIQADWGSEPHIGINQAVEVDAGKYQFDMHITTNGIADAWFEVWVGNEVPVAGDDYNSDDGGTAVLVFNTWDCPNNSSYSGPMAPESCQDTDGTITLDAGTWYVVIRSGGLNFGEDGVV